MPRIYTVVASVTVTSAGGDTDLMEITPATGRVNKLVGLKIGQTSELTDANEENLRIQIARLPATVTSGNGTSTTPRALDSDSGGADFTAEVNATTPATTSGTIEILEEFAWNVRASPYETWWPDLDFAPTVRPGEALVIRLPNGVADDIDMRYTAYIAEL
jgi:hypothetical protein